MRIVRHRICWFYSADKKVLYAQKGALFSLLLYTYYRKIQKTKGGINRDDSKGIRTNGGDEKEKCISFIG